MDGAGGDAGRRLYLCFEAGDVMKMGFLYLIGGSWFPMRPPWRCIPLLPPHYPPLPSPLSQCDLPPRRAPPPVVIGILH